MTALALSVEAPPGFRRRGRLLVPERRPVCVRPRRFIADTPPNLFQPPALVRNSGTGSVAPGTTISITVPTGGHAAGNLVDVAIIYTSNAVSSVTDSRGNTYSARASAGSGSNNIAQWASILGTSLQAADTITVTFTGSTTGASAAVEFSHIAASSIVDGTPSTATSAGTAIDAGTQTTSLDHDLVIAAWALGNGNPGTYTPAAGWTAMGTQPSVSSARYLRWQYRVVATAGSVTPQATITTSRSYAATAVAYKAG